MIDVIGKRNEEHFQMQYSQTPRVNVIVQIPTTMRDGLRAIAAEEGEAVSVVVRRLIVDAVRANGSASRAASRSGSVTLKAGGGNGVA
jgi:hypothetical protein